MRDAHSDVLKKLIDDMSFLSSGRLKARFTPVAEEPKVEDSKAKPSQISEEDLGVLAGEYAGLDNKE